MSAPTEDRGRLAHPALGDLALWYEVFVEYAASTSANAVHFHGPHVVAAAVDLDKVLEAVRRFEAEYGDVVGPGLLPDVESMKAALGGEGSGEGGGNGEKAGTDGRSGGLGHDHVHDHAHDHVRGRHSAVTADEGSPCHNLWHWLHGTS